MQQESILALVTGQYHFVENHVHLASDSHGSSIDPASLHTAQHWMLAIMCMDVVVTSIPFLVLVMVVIAVHQDCNEIIQLVANYC